MGTTSGENMIDPSAFGTPDPEPPGDPWEGSQDYERHQPRTWRPVDLGTILDGTHKPITPDVGGRTDGVGMFYPGRCHTIASESEAGKSWLAEHCAVYELDRGQHVIWIDFEDEAVGVAGRLLALGVDPNVIRERFHYIRPESPITDVVSRGDLAELIGDTRPSYAAIDGVTEGMVLHGLDPLSNKDCATFGRFLPTAIAGQGPAVVSLDHVTKSPDGRGRYAIGAVHKLNGLNGAAYLLDNRAPFGIGVKGTSTIKIAKDRPGQIRRHCLPGAGGLHWYGDLVLDSHDELFAELDVVAPTAKDPLWRPTEVMARVAAALTEHGPLAQRRIEAAVKGRAATIRDAVDYLILDGYVTEKTPHELLKPYPEGGSR
jgi:hypothetical protein